MLNGYFQVRVGAQRNYELLHFPHSSPCRFYKYAGGECVATCLAPSLSMHNLINSYTSAGKSDLCLDQTFSFWLIMLLELTTLV